MSYLDIKKKKFWIIEKKIINKREHAWRWYLLKKVQSNIKNCTHRLPEQQEYDTGQEYTNRLTNTL